MIDKAPRGALPASYGGLIRGGPPTRESRSLVDEQPERR